MNRLEFADLKQTALHHVRLWWRLLDFKRRAPVFSRCADYDALQRIIVINLDRRPDRWHRVRRELNRFYGRNGERLTSLTRRFSAVDARYMEDSPDPAALTPTFTLADQLTVDPNPLLQIDDEARARKIRMTKQEIAVALSHIEVWKLIAYGDVPSTLVLEDDVFMCYGFARALERAWGALDHSQFDLLYLAYEDVGAVNSVQSGGKIRPLDHPGIWEASGYVLTRDGARKLLDALPAFGPIDLWLNLQFERLRAFTTARPIIEQRVDEPSTNSYSILPVLSQVGVVTREKPLLPSANQLPGPVVVVGDSGTGLTALATALSMIGYTCLSDLDRLPDSETTALLSGQGARSFNAYVNIAALDSEALEQIALTHSDAYFIATSAGALAASFDARVKVLRLAPNVRDKWAALTSFIGVEYPALSYPSIHDVGTRTLADAKPVENQFMSTDLTFDRGPWILAGKHRLSHGIILQADEGTAQTATTRAGWTAGEYLDDRLWRFRNDTFPSNLALFVPANVSRVNNEVRLEFRSESTSVRNFTSGSIASVSSYRYGRFSAELRPPNVSGLVTGMFLHRNGPRQEIDIEFLGKDTTKMLVNVFYNPGPNGTKLEYGYRGTPTIIDLGFDAAADFHTYEIDWQPTAIRWMVDGETVYERAIWDPTPIPDQPLEFNLNLWHSRSKEFAGRLDATQLPASASILSIGVRTSSSSQEGESDIEVVVE